MNTRTRRLVYSGALASVWVCTGCAVEPEAGAGAEKRGTSATTLRRAFSDAATLQTQYVDWFQRWRDARCRDFPAPELEESLRQALRLTEAAIFRQTQGQKAHPFQPHRAFAYLSDGTSRRPLADADISRGTLKAAAMGLRAEDGLFFDLAPSDINFATATVTELERVLRQKGSLLTYGTAWRLLHQVAQLMTGGGAMHRDRTPLEADDRPAPLTGLQEAQRFADRILDLAPFFLVPDVWQPKGPGAVSAQELLEAPEVAWARALGTRALPLATLPLYPDWTLSWPRTAKQEADPSDMYRLASPVAVLEHRLAEATLRFGEDLAWIHASAEHFRPGTAPSDAYRGLAALTPAPRRSLPSSLITLRSLRSDFRGLAERGCADLSADPSIALSRTLQSRALSWRAWLGDVFRQDASVEPFAGALERTSVWIAPSDERVFARQGNASARQQAEAKIQCATLQTMHVVMRTLPPRRDRYMPRKLVVAGMKGGAPCGNVVVSDDAGNPRLTPFRWARWPLAIRALDRIQL